MFKPGLVSITFRQLSAEKIIHLAEEAGIEGIEWGGDLHVPHGDIKTAEQIGQKTRDAGLTVASYGSYYRLNHTTDFSFNSVLDTALALQTDIIRIWAGKKSSADADDAYWQSVVEEANNLADKAAGKGVKLAFEWHGNTLTDTAEAAWKLFNLTDHDNLFTYWQPRNCTPPEQCLEDMDAALPRLIGLHVFHWHQETKERLPLREGKDIWRRYLQKARQASDMYGMLEFVRDNDPEQFMQDATTLKELLTEVNQ